MNVPTMLNLPASKRLFDAGTISAINQTLGRQITEHYLKLESLGLESLKLESLGLESLGLESSTKKNTQAASEGILVLSVLTGAMMFTSDLMRYIHIPLRLDCLRVSRYHNKTHGTHLDWHSRPKESIQGQHILLVDDIFDEGETMAELHRYCVSEGAVDVRSAVLLDKFHDRRSVDYVPDFVGCQCPDEYVFGYGMDLEGQFRHLPEIYHLVNSSD